MREHLEGFDPVVQAWFARCYGVPTGAQRRAWTSIASGRHVLVTAPTGSGKTLAAFLWALDGLLSGRVQPGATRTLYVSPLRALNNDIRRNLLAPLEQLRADFDAAGRETPPIQVVTRSGDTAADERARMARRPPEILITTPESLNILLTSQRGQRMLASVQTLILDEVHAVAGSKRGVHLITAVERLAALAGEFQRIALSATVRPLEPIARWVGGYQRDGLEVGRRRDVEVIDESGGKRYELDVVIPDAGYNAIDEAEGSTVWPSVTAMLKESVQRNRATLIFANSRRTVEKLTRLVNQGEADELVYAHHGSLSREIRHLVEARLKLGQARGIVATSSLELGIDIGTLDEVILVQTPPSVASTVQRIGRAGHAVGESSRARFLPLLPRDALDSAVVARAVLDGAIEPLNTIRAPLDVLAQLIVSATAGQEWVLDELFAMIRTSEPYHDLGRGQFDLVLEMLAGRYASTRVRELAPLVSIDRVRNTVRARPGAEMLVYMSGGTIPDRGYFRLRRADSLGVVGELDEEFVWERSIGDSFTLGVQSWRITEITHNDVFVLPAPSGAAMAPFWRAESRDRSFELAELIGLFLETAESRLDDPAWRQRLITHYRLAPPTASTVVDWLDRQRRAMGGRIPHRHRVVLERVVDPQSPGRESARILHTGWGGRVNRPLALALQGVLAREGGAPPQVMHDDDCILLQQAGDAGIDELFAAIRPERLPELLRAGLERTGYFGARFREAAGRALLLPRAGFHRRTPLWLSRLRAKKLLDAVSRFDDFPIRLEAWRECMQDAFDVPALERLLDEVRDGSIMLEQVTTSSPSPFAANVTWKQTNELMYEDDTPEGAPAAALRGDLVREVALAPHLRPRIPLPLVRDLERRLQRTAPGWAPRNGAELLDHVVERLLIPMPEWGELRDAIARDVPGELAQVVDDVADRLAAVALPKAPKGTPAFVCAIESLPRIASAIGTSLDVIRLYDVRPGSAPCPPASLSAAKRLASKVRHGAPAAEVADLLADILASYGPVAPLPLGALLGLPPDTMQSALESLAETQRVVTGELTESATLTEACDTENLERLLRMLRAGARPAFEPLPLQKLPEFLARYQGVGARRGGIESLRNALDHLMALPIPAALWEAEVLPARVPAYQTAWLDSLLAETSLMWLGCGSERIAFLTSAERDLLGHQGKPSAEDRELLAALFPHPLAKFGLQEMKAQALVPGERLTSTLWRLAWRGLISNDGFAAMRRGLEGSFERDHVIDATQGHPGHRSVRADRWRSGLASSGNWHVTPLAAEPADPLEAEDLAQDRARMLLDRWGVVFRELAERELPAMQWSQVSRTLRRMELSGEVVSGQLFHGIPGLQFASREAMRLLREPPADDLVFWLCAADPCSPCGLGLDFGEPLPRRVPGNHLVYAGSRLVVLSENRGRKMRIRVGPDHTRLPEYLAFLGHLLTRQAQPLKSLKVDRINDEPAARSAYRDVLDSLFLVARDRHSLVLMRRY